MDHSTFAFLLMPGFFRLTAVCSCDTNKTPEGRSATFKVQGLDLFFLLFSFIFFIFVFCFVFCFRFFAEIHL